METPFISPSRHIFLKPDPNAWLVPDFIAALKDFKNEFGLTLWNALGEYVNYHSPHCPFAGPLYEGELFLYPILEYNPQNRRASLSRIYYVSKDVKTLLMHNYLEIPGSNKNNTPFMNLFRKNTSEKFEDFPCLEFMVMHNNIEPALAKEMLLKNSFHRQSMKRAFVMENVALGIQYSSANVISIDFDLSFLQNSSFLNAKRYEGFKKLLPPNLIMSVGCRLEFDLPDIPKSLKKQQLISVGLVSQ